MVDDVLVCEHLANSDHNTIFFTFNVSTTIKETSQTRFNFFKEIYVAMSEHLTKINWDSELSSSNVSVLWENFVTIMQNAVNLFIPKCKSRVRKYPIWMDRRTQKARKKKSKMWNKFCLSKSKVDESLYNKARNKATAACCTAKVWYEKSLADNIKTSSKKFYAYVRSKSKAKDSISSIKNKEGFTITDDSKYVMG